MTSAPSSPVAIVGGGAAGTLLALHLAWRHGIPVTLYDDAGAFGRGLAYSATSPWHRLNVPAARMGGWHADDPNCFLRWLAERDGGTPQSQGGRYVERSVYGEWLSAQVFEAVRAGRIRVVAQRVLALQPGTPGPGSHWRLHLEDGQQHAAQAVALCQGNTVPRVLPGTAGHARCLNNPWRAHALAPIGRQDTVLVAGSGASGVDAVLELLHTGHRGLIHLVSRRGLLPRPNALPVPDTPLPGPLFDLSGKAPPTLRDLCRVVRGAISHEWRSGEPWQLTMDAFLNQADALWDGLALADRRRFLRHVRPYWTAFRHRADPAALSRLQAAQDDGQLRRISARIDAVTGMGEGLRIGFRLAGRRGSIMAADWLINATGPEERISKRADPLIDGLLRDGHARAGELGLGLDVTAEGEVLSDDPRATPPLFALGLPTRGAFWEVTSVPALRARAAPVASRLAARLTEQCGGPTCPGRLPEA